MKKIILLMFLSLTGINYGQNDSLHMERYKVINAMFQKVDTEKIGKVELDRNFFPFLGIGAILSDYELMEMVFGYCGESRTGESYKYSEILSQQTISEMTEQISWYKHYRRIDPGQVSDKIKVVRDRKNNKTAISLPLIYKNKAVVYRTNKDNQEDVFVLVKEAGEWEVRCVKTLYLRFDD